MKKYSDLSKRQWPLLVRVDRQVDSETRTSYSCNKEQNRCPTILEPTLESMSDGPAYGDGS